MPEILDLQDDAQQEELIGHRAEIIQYNKHM